MGGFTYFFPGRQAGIPQKVLNDEKLGYLLPGATCKTAGGPGGNAGLLVAGPGGKATHTQDQVWRQVPQSKAWVGFDPQDPPTPEALAKREQLQGHLVELGDGRQWLIPVARGWMEQDDEVRWYVALPQKSSVDENGQWTRAAVVRRHQKLWDYTTKWWSVVADSDGTTTIDFDHEEQSCLCALQTNYIIGAAECDLLELLDDVTRGRLLMALIDWPTYTQIVKKKQGTPTRQSIEIIPDTSTIADGVAA